MRCAAAGLPGLLACLQLLPAPSSSEMSLPMRVRSWDNTEVWRPYVREVAQVVLDNVEGALSLDTIHEHRSRVAPVVGYTAEVEFAPSPDGRREAFNATARLFDGEIVWHAVSGTTMHTQLWLDRQRQLFGEPPPPQAAYALNLLDGVEAEEDADPDLRTAEEVAAGAKPRAKQQQQEPPLLPSEIPTVMTVNVRGAADFSLSPGVPAAQLVGGSVDAVSLPPDVLAERLSTGSGVEVALLGVASMELAEPLALECDLPFRWHPPMIFPPLEGGRRLAGWFLVNGFARVDEGAALSVTLTPHPAGPDHPSGSRSMPRGWVPVGLAGVVATWDVDDEDDEMDEDDALLEAELLRDLGLDDEEDVTEEDEGDDSYDIVVKDAGAGAEGEELEEEGDEKPSTELLKFMRKGGGESSEATLPHELAPEEDLVFFKGVLTDERTGLPLGFCPGGFSMTRSVATPQTRLPSYAPNYTPLMIEDPGATKPDEWDDEDDGEWSPALVVNPAAAAGSLGLGEGWVGSYECVGKPTRAEMNILEVEQRAADPANVVRFIANMSFYSVTQTGGFAVRPSVGSSKPLQFDITGESTTAVAQDQGVYKAAFEVVADDGQVGLSQPLGVRELLNAQPLADADVALPEGKPSGEGLVEDEAPHTVSSHNRVVLKSVSDRLDFYGRDTGPFAIRADESRVSALLRSVEAVYNQTKQVATRLTKATAQPIVIFRIVIDVKVPGDTLRVEAVVERDWGGVRQAKPVTLRPSFVESSVHRVTSLVSTSLMKKDKGLDLVELAEQLKLSPEAVQTLQKALTTTSEPSPDDEAVDSTLDERAGADDDATKAKKEIDRQIQLRERIGREIRERADQAAEREAVEQAAEDEEEAAGAAAWSQMFGGTIRAVRGAFRQAANFPVAARLWQALERGHRQVLGGPVDPQAPLQAGFLLLAAIVSIVIGFLGVLDAYARRR